MKSITASGFSAQQDGQFLSAASYNTLQRTWEEATTDKETKASIQGVAAQMITFTYLFGSMLGGLVLKHADNLSKTRQQLRANRSFR